MGADTHGEENYSLETKNLIDAPEQFIAVEDMKDGTVKVHNESGAVVTGHFEFEDNKKEVVFVPHGTNEQCRGEWKNDCPWPECKCAKEELLRMKRENPLTEDEAKEEFYMKYDEDYSAELDSREMTKGCRRMVVLALVVITGIVIALVVLLP